MTVTFARLGFAAVGLPTASPTCAPVAGSVYASDPVTGYSCPGTHDGSVPTTVMLNPNHSASGSIPPDPPLEFSSGGKILTAPLVTKRTNKFTEANTAMISTGLLASHACT